MPGIRSRNCECLDEFVTRTDRALRAKGRCHVRTDLFASPRFNEGQSQCLACGCVRDDGTASLILSPPHEFLMRMFWRTHTHTQGNPVCGRNVLQTFDCKATHTDTQSGKTSVSHRSKHKKQKVICRVFSFLSLYPFSRCLCFQGYLTFAV